MQTKSIDTTLVFLVLWLMIFGMVMISSVSVYSSFKITSDLLAKGRIDEVWNAFYLVRNISHVIVSILMLVIFTKTPYTIFEKNAPWIFGVALLFMLMVFMPGIGASYNGASGWIDIPGLPSIQPVEFMKLALIIMLAYFMKKRRSRLADFSHGFIPYFFYFGIVVFLLAMQPDFWSVLILTPVVVMMYFIGWGNVRFLLISLGIAVMTALTVYGIGKTEMGEKKFGYISGRIDNYFRDSKEITELGNEHQDYQLKQGFIALGSGGFSGLGFGKSIQKFGYLPEVQGDFIFSVIVEELGFIGAFLLFSVYMVIVYRGFYIARSVKDLFGKYMAFGLTFWIFVQASINIGVNLHMVPLTGVTLSFVSYGGSSLVSLAIAVGILLSISRHSEYVPQNLSDALQARRRVIL